MKRTLLILTAGLMLFTACQSDPKADQAKTGEAQEVGASTGNTYQADLAQSRVEWTGTKPVGQHRAAIKLQEGSVTVDNGAVTGGKFVIDMNSMQLIDEDTATNRKLGGHLKGDDFFQVEKYPSSNFEITGVKAGIDQAAGEELVMKDATHTVTGNLTLKGITKSITFPARISVSDNSVSADANFNIDRTQWNIVYGNDKGLGDTFIRPTVNIVLHLVANK
jgi:polyisoprenoid-binding protein YceI